MTPNFVIVDRIEATRGVTVDWLIIELGGDSFRYTGEYSGFYGQFVYSPAGRPVLNQKEGFEDVDPDEIEGLETYWHLRARFPEASSQIIATLLVAYPKSSPKRLFPFIDDQGYHANLYVTDSEDRQFKIVIPKAFQVD